MIAASRLWGERTLLSENAGTVFFKIINLHGRRYFVRAMTEHSKTYYILFNAFRQICPAEETYLEDIVKKRISALYLLNI